MIGEMATHDRDSSFGEEFSTLSNTFGSLDGQAEFTPICELKGQGFFTLFQEELFIDVDRNINLEHYTSHVKQHPTNQSDGEGSRKAT